MIDRSLLSRTAELAAYGHAEAGLAVGVLARECVDDQVAAPVGAALAVDALELTAARQPAPPTTRPVRHG